MSTILNEQGKANHLIHEKSPYLLQHAYNPVKWYPWGKAAFEKAKREHKPIFLSIGYSTCHWCHVMEQESFEDEEVAQLMNRAFVNIKVDREERPDIDAVYMKVSQVLTGSGGWSLNIIMTPDKKPFFAATYIPKENRFGRVGLLTLIPKVETAWRENRQRLLQNAAQIVAALNQSAAERGGNLSQAELTQGFEELQANYDSLHGGFGTAPKFPSGHTLIFLLRYWKASGEKSALSMSTTTLQKMREGGIFDQVGFGFHRYSTDAEWRVPHFEKMLYDQGMLALSYLEAYQATRDARFAQTAQEIFTYLLRDMLSPEGAFYSAEDADSEGQEGKFYLWKKEELLAILSPQEIATMNLLFDISPQGNFSAEATGNDRSENILFLKRSFAKLSSQGNLSERALQAKWAEVRDHLFAEREKREHPFKDDKILTDWNGLIITALARSAWILGEKRYLKAAEQAAAFIQDKLYRSDGRLWHRYRAGEAAVIANLDDYAFLAAGYLALYEASFQIAYLARARALTQEALSLFWDKKNSGFFLTAANAEKLIARPKELYDGALPSGNSVMLLNMLKLSRLTGDTEFAERAEQLLQAFSAQVKHTPSAFTFFLSGLSFALGPSYEIVIVGSAKAPDTQAMLQALKHTYLPQSVILLKTSENAEALARLAPFTKNQSAKNKRATAYVCQNFICNLPTTDPQKMLRLLKE